MVTYVCGYNYDRGVECACSYLPDAVVEEHGDNLVFMSTAERDACRVAAQYREKEIILLSDRILPKAHDYEEDANVRYFIFAVLHEVVHAIRNHRPNNALTPEEIQAQENEADEQALEWFNQHVEERNNPDLLPLTMVEVNQARELNQELMHQLYEE